MRLAAELDLSSGRSYRVLVYKNGRSGVHPTNRGFAVSFVIYSAIWALPNYIYFKKRRILFSGPPLVEGGIRGILGAIWRFIWPTIDSPESAIKASREGFYASGIVTSITLILVAFSASGHPLYGIDLWSLLDTAIFAVITLGIYRLWRTASALGVLFFISSSLSKIISWTTRPVQSPPYLFIFAATTLILGMMFFNGTRGTFSCRRYQKAAAHNPQASGQKLNSMRWQIYSAVLTSFILGVLALRAYQFVSRETMTSGKEPRPVASSTDSSSDLTALGKEVRPAVVTIMTYNSHGQSIGQGSGFFTNKDGEVLTNHHVMKAPFRRAQKPPTATLNLS